MVLRELFLKLGLEVDEAAFAKGELAASLVEAALEKVVDVAKEMAHEFVENVKEAIEYGNVIKNTSQQIGIGVEALQELQYAAKLSDLSAEDLTSSVGKLARNMHAAAKGGDEQAKAFEKLHIKVKDQKGGLRSLDDVMGDVAEKFHVMPDGAEKTALAMEIFGKAGKKMIPLLNKGREELAETRKEARELGLVMSDETAEASEELSTNFNRLRAISQGLWRQVIGEFLPTIGEIVKKFLAWRKANAQLIAQKLHTVIGFMVSALKMFVSVMESVIRNLTFFKVLLGAAGIYGAIQMLIPKFEALIALGVRGAAAMMWAWIKAAAPFAAIAAVLAAMYLIFDDIKAYTEGRGSLYGRFKKEIDEWLKPKAEDPWFVVALKKFIEYIRDAIELLRRWDHFIDPEGATKRDLKQSHPEFFDQNGKYVGRQDVTFQNGRQVQLRRGEVKIGGQTARKSGSKTGRFEPGFETYDVKDDPNAPVYGPAQSPFAPSAPEYRGSAWGPPVLNKNASSNQVNVTINAGSLNDHRQLANMVGDEVDKRMQDHAEKTAAGIRGR